MNVQDIFRCATCRHWAGDTSKAHAMCRRHNTITFAQDTCAEYLGGAHTPPQPRAQKELFPKRRQTSEE